MAPSPEKAVLRETRSVNQYLYLYVNLYLYLYLYADIVRTYSGQGADAVRTLCG